MRFTKEIGEKQAHAASVGLVHRQPVDETGEILLAQAGARELRRQPLQTPNDSGVIVGMV